MVGTRVCVLKVAEALRKVVPPDEWQNLQAMVGETYRVYEIDEYGSAWVQTPLVPTKDGYTRGDSLALDAGEMEVVARSRRRRTRG